MIELRTAAEAAWDEEMAYANFETVGYPEAAKLALAAFLAAYKPGEASARLEKLHL